ncbi:TolB family protein [Paenibacillus glycanilyticus]|uniref:TolB family protein n=1 Tax=Paenibacillus glycanilyticus TaxID=126569 RepID=UPI000FD7EB55|nr:PD40 domain-containing protein [Paenibacillus glycanilyticus]
MIKKLTALIMAAVVVSSLLALTSAAAEGEREALQAAFIRTNNLWLAVDEVQKPLTKEEYIRSPQWSKDGNWMTFLRGENRPEVWTYEAATGGMRRLGEGSNAKWAPNDNRLAILSGRTLSVMSADRPSDHSQDRIMDNAGEFSWLPDGSGLLASTAAELLPEGGWAPIELYVLKPDGAGGAWSKQLFYRLPAQSDDFFAIQTSPFKWSPDGKWIAFIAKPTASLSSDANTLILLSSDGRSFVKAGQMLGYANWFQWAPSSGQLAFIEGTGREATSNKKLAVLEDILSVKKRVLTPRGYADNDFTWDRDEAIIVSRRKESAWSGDEEDRTLPLLAKVNLRTGQSKNVTRGIEGYGDYAPTIMRNGMIAFVQSGQGSAEVKLIKPGARRSLSWITKLTVAEDYYGRANWSDMIGYLNK